MAQQKFPLTLHATGQYCKKIKGKAYYFGKDKDAAYVRYLQKDLEIRTGKPAVAKTLEGLTVHMLCNMYIERQEGEVRAGNISRKRVITQLGVLRRFIKSQGEHCLVSEVSPSSLAKYRNGIIKAGFKASTIETALGTIKATFNWAVGAGHIEKTPNFYDFKNVKKKDEQVRVFTMAEIKAMLEFASVELKACIWLGLNCAFGNTDCGKLEWRHLDLDNARVAYPRGKTGVMRRTLLWPETIEALSNVPRKGKLVFYTRSNNPFVRISERIDKNGNVKYTPQDAVGTEFKRLVKLANIKADKGVSFYTLRRTAATFTARSGDPYAVQRLLGHKTLNQASVYVGDVTAQTDAALNDVRDNMVNA